jgi:hypothetical protein
MGILDNLESSLDFQYESTPIKAVDNTGLALKIFTETCCNGCTCKSESDHKPVTAVTNEIVGLIGAVSYWAIPNTNN